MCLFVCVLCTSKPSDLAYWFKRVSASRFVSKHVRKLSCRGICGENRLFIKYASILVVFKPSFNNEISRLTTLVSNVIRD